MGMIYAIINKFFYGSYGDSDFKKSMDIFREYYDGRRGGDNFLF
jgi:hypothetical protein